MSPNPSLAAHLDAFVAMAASSDASVATGDSKEATADTSTAQKRGVVYLARVPPFMKPAKVRHLLEMAGPIDRIYLVPESEKDRRFSFQNDCKRFRPLSAELTTAGFGTICRRRVQRQASANGREQEANVY